MVALDMKDYSEKYGKVLNILAHRVSGGSTRVSALIWGSRCVVMFWGVEFSKCSEWDVGCPDLVVLGSLLEL